MNIEAPPCGERLMAEFAPFLGLVRAADLVLTWLARCLVIVVLLLLLCILTINWLLEEPLLG